LILFLSAVALPACQLGEPGTEASQEKLVATSTTCQNGEPTCNTALDYPNATDLQMAIDSGNAADLAFSSADNALLVTGDDTVFLLDSDADGVPDPADDCVGPGWRTPCDGDASNDGVYFTLDYDSSGALTVQTEVQVYASLETIDAYLLVDTSLRMDREINTLSYELTTGTFVDTTECPEGLGTGLIGAIKCRTPNARFGLGSFGEIPLLPHATPYSQAPYHHYLDQTRNLTHLTDAVSSLVTRYNEDYPDAATQAIYSVLTGQGLGPYVPNRAGCPAGSWGYSCFADTALVVLMIVSDSSMYNAPSGGNNEYGDPPFDGVLGASALLPPVRMSPNVLYANDPGTAWDLGDLTSTSMTVMGTNTNFDNNATTWNVSACQQCTDPMDVSTCWVDGSDAFVKFSLGATISPFLSGEGTAYPAHNVAVFDATPAGVDCDPGPGGGDYWGRLTPTLAPGDYYLVSDAAVPLGVSSSDVRGPYQLRIQTTPSDASWATADLPVPWADIGPLFTDNDVKIVAVLSESPAKPDMDELALATGSVDRNGNTYVSTVASSGFGLSDALIAGLDLLVNNTRRDVTLVAEDNPATGAVDESGFLQWVSATSCPTGAEPNCLGGDGAATCTQCLNDAQIAFEFALSNAIVPGGNDHQRFDFDMVALADGEYELNRTPVRVLVPRDGPYYQTGYYQNAYDSTYACVTPPERPDWGTLTWSGSTPSDSTVEFEFYTADTLEELDSANSVSIVYPTNTTSQTYDVGDELLAAGLSNYGLFLRVRAKLNGSGDASDSPVFEGWSMEFNCVPYD
jgi:hypothetical protein